jgi:hypothetical protein
MTWGNPDSVHVKCKYKKLGYATPKLNYAHQHKKGEQVMNKIHNAG